MKKEDKTEGKVFYQKVDKTMYVVNVKQAENAKEAAEDILARVIAKESAK